jgi:hypothetical protein
VAEMQAAEIENSRKGKWRRRRIYSVEDISMEWYYFRDG